MPYKYSKELKTFIAENVKGTTTKELVELVNAKFGTNFTESKMKSYKTNNNLKSGTQVGLPAGRPTKLYPEHIKAFIAEHYTGVGPMDMTELLNNTFKTSYTVKQLKSYYANNKINSALDGRFQKMHIPANKGQKGYHAPGSEKGWFKKGNTPKNHRQVGSERVDVDGYTLVKTAEPNVWELKHKLIWEEKNGRVPEGHILTFLDGNKANITLDNLIIISMAESLEMNRSKLRSDNSEFTKTGVLIARIKTTIGKSKKTASE
jgi:hypothetical protein